MTQAFETMSYTGSMTGDDMRNWMMEEFENEVHKGGLDPQDIEDAREEVLAANRADDEESGEGDGV